MRNSKASSAPTCSDWFIDHGQTERKWQRAALLDRSEDRSFHVIAAGAEAYLNAEKNNDPVNARVDDDYPPGINSPLGGATQLKMTPSPPWRS